MVVWGKGGTYDMETAMRYNHTNVPDPKTMKNTGRALRQQASLRGVM